MNDLLRNGIVHEDLIFTLEEVAQCFKFILCGCRSGSMSWSYPIDIIYCAHYEPTHSGNKRPAAIHSGLFEIVGLLDAALGESQIISTFVMTW